MVAERKKTRMLIFTIEKKSRKQRDVSIESDSIEHIASHVSADLCKKVTLLIIPLKLPPRASVT